VTIHDDAEIGSDGEDVDFGVGEEGNNVLDVEHLAAKLVGLCVDEAELNGEVLGETTTLLGRKERRAAVVEEREGVGGVDREGRRKEGHHHGE
jgi:hypothetical protein